MTDKHRELLSPHALVLLSTVLTVFVAGMAMAPELIAVFAPACMASLSATYLLVRWIEGR